MMVARDVSAATRLVCLGVGWLDNTGSPALLRREHAGAGRGTATCAGKLALARGRSAACASPSQHTVRSDLAACICNGATAAWTGRPTTPRSSGNDTCQFARVPHPLSAAAAPAVLARLWHKVSLPRRRVALEAAICHAPSLYASRYAHIRSSLPSGGRGSSLNTLPSGGRGSSLNTLSEEEDPL